MDAKKLTNQNNYTVKNKKITQVKTEETKKQLHDHHSNHVK